MADRSLPTRKNPLLGPVTDDDYRQELISKRRLGQTDLVVGQGQVGTSNATKPKNLGAFDYAHIRVPLPKDLKGSGVFHPLRGHSPDAYFLMRRSSDGYVSASGMFKVAFPWATQEEEAAEKLHLKTVPGVGKEEIAGNIWVPPQTALDIADEYEIRDWIVILLDPATMTAAPDCVKTIKSPPVFTFKPVKRSRATKSPTPSRTSRAKTPTFTNGTSLLPPDESPEDKSPRKRALRSASPTKIPMPDRESLSSRKIATPKRTKRGRQTGASVEPEDAPAPKTTGRKVSKTTKKEEEETIKVHISSTTEGDVDSEATTTRVEIDSPADHRSNLPDEAQAYLDSAQKSLREANKLSEEHKASVRGRKRKANSISHDDGDDAIATSSAHVTRAEDENVPEEELPAPKKVKLSQIEERKEKIKKRATVGIAAGLAVGAIVPFLVGAFSSAL